MVGNAGIIEAEVVLVSKKSRDEDEIRWVYLDIGKFGGLGCLGAFQPCGKLQGGLPSGFLMPVEPCGDRRLRDLKIGGKGVDPALAGLAEGMKLAHENGQEEGGLVAHRKWLILQAEVTQSHLIT
jgi:hypothetical protein